MSLSLEVLAVFDMTLDIGVDDAGVMDLRKVVFLGVGNACEDIEEEIFQMSISPE